MEESMFLVLCLVAISLQGALGQRCSEHPDCADLKDFANGNEGFCDKELAILICPCSCGDSIINNPPTNEAKLVTAFAEYYNNTDTYEEVCGRITESTSFVSDVCNYVQVNQNINDNAARENCLAGGQSVEFCVGTSFVRVRNIPDPVIRTESECQQFCVEKGDSCSSVYIGESGSDREGECFLNNFELDVTSGEFGRVEDMELFRKTTGNLCIDNEHGCICVPDAVNTAITSEFNCDARGLDAIPRLQLPTDSVSLRENSLSIIPRGAFFGSYYGQVLTLDLSENQINVIEPGAFGALNSLQTLALASNPLNVASFDYDLENRGAFSLVLVNGVELRTPLQELDISNTNFNFLPSEFFVRQEISGISRLIARNLASVKYVGLDTFSVLPGLVNDSATSTSQLVYGGTSDDEFDTTLSTCINRAHTIFCECADGYGPGWWRSADLLDHHGCFEGAPQASTPEVVEGPTRDSSGIAATMKVKVTVPEEMVTIAYLRVEVRAENSSGVTTSVSTVTLCCESQEEQLELPATFGLTGDVNSACTQEAACGGEYTKDITNLPTSADVRVSVVTSNQARIDVEGSQSDAVTTPEAVKHEDSFLEEHGGAVFGTVVAVILILIGVILYIRRRIRLRPVSRQSFQDLLESLKKDGFIADNEYVESEHTVPTELPRPAIKMISVLGSGAFGEVRKASLSDNYNKGLPSEVAVKVTKPGVAADRDEFLREAVISAQFDHENIVRMIGVVTSGEPLLMVIELCDQGNLKGFLEERGEDGPMASWSLSSEQMLTILKQTAKGLAHLASKRFVHRDIAARNVLVTSDFVFKIADFGLGREVKESSSGDDSYYKADRRGPLPVRWCSPEALNDQRFSMASDVWAWGVMAYEVFSSGKQPYEGMSNHEVWIKVSDGYRLECPELCSEDIWEGVIMPCFEETPGKRPSFEVLVARLDQKDRRSTTFDSDYLELVSKGNEYASDIPAPNLPISHEYEYSAGVDPAAPSPIVAVQQKKGVPMHEYEYQDQAPELLQKETPRRSSLPPSQQAVV